MFTPRELQLERGWPGIIEGDTVVQVAAQTLQAYFTGGGTARRHAEYPLAGVEMRAPVLHPSSVRDFYAFEQHVKTARAARGQDVPEEWYEIPVFYFSNPAAIYGPEDQIPYPPDTRELDYELELAAVIGAEGQIGGFTIMNDWSARDLQRAEMKVGLGPSKGKDFATSLGPIIVTPEEFDGSRGTMTARVNGENGLLSPAWVDPDSGYRYYRADQLHTATLIALFRSAGMPLVEIRSFLGSPSVERLETYEREVADEFAERRRVLRYVKRILKEEPMYDVLTRHVDEQAYVSRTKHLLVPDLEPFI